MNPMISRRARKPASRQAPRKVLTKAMLLPPTPESARELSLRNHMVVAACSSGAGSRALLRELFAVACLSYFLRDAGFFAAPDTLYHDVQRVLEHCVACCASADTWAVDEHDGAALAALISVYDQQFAAAPMYVMDGARKRLLRLANGEWRFPWQPRPA
ncbi:hypothetical protein [Paraburkholderia flava]|uniref:hypothetical protein n=1 Tax=Paraburkholderia flava TaxID=2547393 RepID=UPI00105B4C5E|nr:hypothetical protein [Paraburkholderia flava]